MAPGRERDDGPRGRWRAPVAVRASALVHGAAAVAAVAEPTLWPWALGAVAANHVLLAAAGIAPRGTLIGDNLDRLPPASAARGEIALTFDDGPDPAITPRVLDRLAAAGAAATFFCVGQRVARHPALARRIVEAGHAIGNHSHRHSTGFVWSGPSRLAREVDDAQRAIADATGVVPRWFRAPFGARTPLLDPVLWSRGLRLVSWTARGYDTVSRDPDAVARRLVAGAAPGAVLLLHDGRATGGRAGGPAAIGVDALPPLLEALRARGLRPTTLDAAVPLPAATPDPRGGTAAAPGARSRP